MAKKKCNKKTTPKSKSLASKFEKLITTIAVLAFAWLLISSFFSDGKLGPAFWIAVVFLLVFLVAKIIISGFMGRSFTYYVKKLKKNFNEWKASHADDDDDDDYEDVDDVDDDDDDAEFAEHGYTLVKAITADGKEVTVPVPNDAMLKDGAKNAWTLVSKTQPDGSVICAVVEAAKLIPANLPKGKKVGALNVAIDDKKVSKPVDAADKALATKLLAKKCPPADLAKKVADAKSLIATGLFDEDEAVAQVMSK
jgi:archaellum component FlaG (FlaF/FlaG flagellin family)